jgi:hypothetical protein
LRDEDRALRFEPIPQRRRGEAIVSIISRNEGPLRRADEFEIAEFKPGLDLGGR